MSSLEQWQVDNDQYLAVALHWLRLRLTKIAEATSSAAPSSKGLLPRRLTTPVSSVMSDELTQAEQALAEAAQMQPPPALVVLSEQFGLSPFEQNVLLL